MESRSPTTSRSPAPIERPQSSHDEKKATDAPKARTGTNCFGYPFICDEWYRNLCIIGAEKAVEEDVFHYRCVKNGKRKSAQAQQPKKRQTV
ncbi:hypothetical protein AAVH_19321 [Aphelenchoides avenae]|nr:hypothetical protein AAVH_19321 [Aphelenchus avenae]